jgi:hypothetical protein
MAAPMNVKVAWHVMVVIVVRHELARMVVEVGRIMPMRMTRPTSPTVASMSSLPMMPMPMRRSYVDMDSTASIMKALRLSGRSIQVNQQ